MVPSDKGAFVRNLGGMVLTIYVDTREKPRAIEKILSYYVSHDVEVVRRKLDEGDYKLDPDGLVTVDRKQNLLEVCHNLTWDRERFQRELRRCSDKGITIYVLVEHGGQIKSLDDVPKWKNPRLKTSPKAVSGPQLYKIMLTWAAKYGVRWRFCDKRNTGKEILKILTEFEEKNHE
jgi:hypothetical protein